MMSNMISRLARNVIPTSMVLLLGFISLSSCEEEIVSEPAEKRDHWAVVDSGDYPLIDWGGKMVFGADGLGLLTRSPFGLAYSCKDQGSDWQVHIVDSSYQYAGQTYIVRTDVDGTIWVLNDLKLTHILGCGQHVGYAVNAQDTSGLSIYDTTFVGMEVIDGTPWLLHREWGLFRFDLATMLPVHVPIIAPFIIPIEELPPFNSMAKSALGEYEQEVLWVANKDGYIAIHEPGPFGWTAAFDTYLFVNLRNAPNGDRIGDNYNDQIFQGTYNLTIDMYHHPLKTMDYSISPGFYTTTIIDPNSQLTYWSRYPYNQPYIGIQPPGDDPRDLNVRHAVEDGNVLVYDVAYSPEGELHVLTDRGIFKYTGSDE